MNLVCNLLWIYSTIVILRIVLAMVVEFGRVPWGHPVRRISDTLGLAVDPVLGPLRRILPGVPIGGMRLDLSPLVLILGISVVSSIIC